MRLSRTALFCFLAVYVIWGSTYLAIKLAVETIPVWMLVTVRSVAAASIMFALSAFAKEKKLESAEMKIAVLSGMLLFISNGMIGFIEKSISSGVTAVVVGSMPIWIMVFGWAFFRQPKPSVVKIGGGVIGLLGVALIASENLTSPSTGAAFGMIALFISMWLWAFGTLIQRRASSVLSPFKFSAVQMIAGAAPTFALSLLSGESMNVAATSHASAWALVYLILFGSVVGFTAFSWLARNIDTRIVSTYALVNPVVAVVLGSAIYHEPVTPRFFAAILLIGTGLVLLIRPSVKLVPAR